MSAMGKYAPFVVVIIVLIAMIVYKNSQIDDLISQNEQLTAALTISQHEATQAAAQINAQNAKIAEYTIDMEDAKKRYAENVASLQAQNAKARVEVVKELVRDPSCENELALIKEQLGLFYE
jgi:heme exporter protein D